MIAPETEWELVFTKNSKSELNPNSVEYNSIKKNNLTVPDIIEEILISLDACSTKKNSQKYQNR